jgi:hypothetical protein
MGPKNFLSVTIKEKVALLAENRIPVFRYVADRFVGCDIGAHWMLGENVKIGRATFLSHAQYLL